MFSILFVKILRIMWQQEGQEEDEDLFDDAPKSFVLCALHQGAIFFVLFLIIEINF